MDSAEEAAALGDDDVISDEAAEDELGDDCCGGAVTSESVAEDPSVDDAGPSTPVVQSASLNSATCRKRAIQAALASLTVNYRTVIERKSELHYFHLS